MTGSNAAKGFDAREKPSNFQRAGRGSYVKSCEGGGRNMNSLMMGFYLACQECDKLENCKSYVAERIAQIHPSTSRCDLH